MIFYLIALIEGFSTLAVEIIALRLAVPIIGSSAILTGELLAVVLLALSFGYWFGGKNSVNIKDLDGLLMRNFLISGFYYAFLSFPLLGNTLDMMVKSFGLEFGILVASVILLGIPVFLASQTIPLLTQHISTGHSGSDSAKMLFFSTLGSVLAGTLTPIILFPSFGVQLSASIVASSLVLLGVFFAIRKKTPIVAVLSLLGLPLIPLVDTVFKEPATQYFDTAYQSFQLVDLSIPSNFQRFGKGRPSYTRETTLMISGGVIQSAWDRNRQSSVLHYANMIQDSLPFSPTSSMLVLGSAGFSLPEMLAARGVAVIAVDVDPSVKSIAEEHVLKQKLSERIQFVAQSARFFLRSEKAKKTIFDACIVDTFNAKTIPLELSTLEFFRDLKAICKLIVMNAIVDHQMQSEYYNNLATTLGQALGDVFQLEISTSSKARFRNVLLSSSALNGFQAVKQSGLVYTDNMSRAEADYLQLWR